MHEYLETNHVNMAFRAENCALLTVFGCKPCHEERCLRRLHVVCQTDERAAQCRLDGKGIHEVRFGVSDRRVREAATRFHPSSCHAGLQEGLLAEFGLHGQAHGVSEEIGHWLCRRGQGGVKRFIDRHRSVVAREEVLQSIAVLDSRSVARAWADWAHIGGRRNGSGREEPERSGGLHFV